MTDNNMNISNTPEQELDLHQLEQVSGGFRGARKPKETTIAGEVPAACGDSIRVKGNRGDINPADNPGGFDGDDINTPARPVMRVRV